MITCDTYLVPTSLGEALQALSEAPEGARLIAGATDTLPWARQGRAGDVAGDVHVPTLIDVTRVPDLCGYRVVDDGRVRLGANVTFQMFLEDDALAEHLPHMPACALWFADDQIRRQATIAGNVVNASPAADGVPPLVALNAAVELAGTGGTTRTVALADFIEGPGRTQLKAGEIVTAIVCDSAKGYGGSFEKVGHRRSLVISVACASACVKPSADGTTFDDVRLALGGVGPVPMRLADVEAFLTGKPIDADTILAASAMPVDRVASRSRVEYRRGVVRGFVERAIVDALAAVDIAVDGLTEEKRIAAHG